LIVLYVIASIIFLSEERGRYRERERERGGYGKEAGRHGDASLHNIFPALPRHVVPYDVMVLSRSPSLGSESLERSITRASSLARVATARRCYRYFPRSTLYTRHRHKRALAVSLGQSSKLKVYSEVYVLWKAFMKKLLALYSIFQFI